MPFGIKVLLNGAGNQAAGCNSSCLLVWWHLPLPGAILVPPWCSSWQSFSPVFQILKLTGLHTPTTLSQGFILKLGIMFVISHNFGIDVNKGGVVTLPHAVVASTANRNVWKIAFFFLICELSSSLLAVRVQRLQSQPFSWFTISLLSFLLVRIQKVPYKS